ncbi:Uncharacterised protein [Halioglobus japonicus]|nr:Uncharacterised protein [Halioglobus japonicus]
MASNLPKRDAAKRAITDTIEEDPEYNQAISESESFKFRLAQENNRHAEQKAKIDKGMLGVFLGHESHAASAAAIIALFAGFIGFFYFSESPAYADKCMALGMSALGFMFGRSSSK